MTLTDDELRMLQHGRDWGGAAVFEVRGRRLFERAVVQRCWDQGLIEVTGNSGFYLTDYGLRKLAEATRL